MSGIKARLMKKTGLEFYDTAYEIDKEIWKFIKGNFKGKTEGIPVRYWQTHAVPLHEECWHIIAAIKKANSIYPPYTEETCKMRKRLQQEAIGHVETLYEMLRLTLIEIEGIDANKLNTVLELMSSEVELLRKWKSSTRINKKDQPPSKA
ncbi:MAG: hypothetical protein IKG87_02850 [Clostridia bacterium]|nr:hypothetical protein [Clostridia bacterium]